VQKQNRENIVWRMSCLSLVLWLRLWGWLGTDIQLNWSEVNWTELHWISDCFQFSSWERQYVCVVVRAAPKVGLRESLLGCSLPNRNLTRRFPRHDEVKYFTLFTLHLKAATGIGL
jgi:hypothetical protein